MKTKLPVSVASFCVLAWTICAAHAAGEWKLVWSDEFAQPDGTLPNPIHWTHDLGGQGWGNNELQTYTSRSNNARIENGRLVIEAHREDFTGTDGVARKYTSARLKTQSKAEWAYGRFEARIKIPHGQGLWPAFWMLGTNFTSAGWPKCGEIDIMENVGREPYEVHGTIHGPGYSGGNGIGGGFTLGGGAQFADDFHVFAVEWTTNLLRWYVDDRAYFTLSPTNLPSGTKWVFTRPQFLLLNLAVGGNWPGNPNSATVFPQRLEVDYVRVYSLSRPIAEE